MIESGENPVILSNPGKAGTPGGGETRRVPPDLGQRL